MKRIIVCLAAACLFVPSLFAKSKDVGITGTVQFGVGSFGTEFKKAFLQPGITISEEYGVGGGVSVFSAMFLIQGSASRLNSGILLQPGIWLQPTANIQIRPAFHARP